MSDKAAEAASSAAGGAAGKVLHAITQYDKTQLNRTKTVVQDKAGNLYEETIAADGTVHKTLIGKVEGERKAPQRSPYRKFERFNNGTGDWEKVGSPDTPISINDLKSIKLVTYNVWFVDKFFEERRAALCRILEQLSPEVICLQEVTERFLQYVIGLDWVRKEYAISDTHGHTVTPYGVILLTKLPLRRLALHPLQSRMGRKLLVAELSLMDSTMAISTVHLESMETNTNKRCQQLLYIMDDLLAQYDHAMVMGDFNFHEESVENEKTLETHPQYLDMWKEVHPGENGSSVTETRTRFAGWRIDRMLVRSDHFRPVLLDRIGMDPILYDEYDNEEGEREREPIYPSDHYGLRGLIAPAESADERKAAVLEEEERRYVPPQTTRDLAKAGCYELE